MTMIRVLMCSDLENHQCRWGRKMADLRDSCLEKRNQYMRKHAGKRKDAVADSRGGNTSLRKKLIIVHFYV